MQKRKFRLVFRPTVGANKHFKLSRLAFELHVNIMETQHILRDTERDLFGFTGQQGDLPEPLQLPHRPRYAGGEVADIELHGFRTLTVSNIGQAHAGTQ